MNKNNPDNLELSNMAKDRRWLRLHVYGAMVVFQL